MQKVMPTIHTIILHDCISIVIEYEFDVIEVEFEFNVIEVESDVPKWQFYFKI